MATFVRNIAPWMLSACSGRALRKRVKNRYRSDKLDSSRQPGPSEASIIPTPQDVAVSGIESATMTKMTSYINVAGQPTLLSIRPSYSTHIPPPDTKHYNVQEGQLLYLQYVPPRSYCQRCTHAADKSTWWGCGNHIPTVMDDVPDQDRCSCSPQVDVEGKKYPPKAANA
jgi:hypothetical protein